MNVRKKIAVFPEPGAVGPVMNLIGIAQGLRDLGHECVFVLDPGLAGVAKRYGFEERHLSCMEPMSPEESARYWGDFMLKYLPTFRASPYEQIPTYVKACWEAIVDTSKWSVRNGLAETFRSIQPDLIINDNVALYPDTEAIGCPWVRMISCSENEITDPDIPPHLSGCGENDREGFERYRARFAEVMKPVHDDFMDFIASCGHERLAFPEFVLPSQQQNPSQQVPGAKRGALQRWPSISESCNPNSLPASSRQPSIATDWRPCAEGRPRPFRSTWVGAAISLATIATSRRVPGEARS
jgi:UDP:flavonoid glycosyltransferase YjiC (YdhE family)